MSFRLPGGRAAEALRFVVVADDTLARDALERLLAGHDDLRLAEGPADADVVLWDSGVEAEPPPRRVRALGIGIVALVPDARAAAEMAASGASAVARDADAGRIAAALLAASQGLIVIDAAFAEDVVPALPDAEELVDPLTPREREVLELLAAGLSNRRIAERLGISEHTAKFHVNGVFAKLGVTSRTEAVVVAARRGVLML